MSTLIYIPTGLHSPELEIMLSRTQQAIDKGEEVVVVGCPGGGGYACVYNIHGLAPICFVCKKQRARGIKNLRGRYTYLESHQLQAKQCSPDRCGAALKDRCAVKAAHFRGVDVGLAAYSSYTGKARDLDLEGSVARSSLSKLLCSSELLTAYFFDLVQELDPFCPVQILVYLSQVVPAMVNHY